MTLSLLDDQGNLLARFSPLKPYGGSPKDILWAPSKDRAAVVFSGPASTGMSFLIIDRDGRQLSEVIHGYYYPVWSPTQDLVAFEGTQGEDRLLGGENHLCIIDGSGRFLAVGALLAPRLSMSSGDLSQWSPGGTCAAVTVKIGEMLVPQDDFLAVACADGTLLHIKLRDYNLNNGHLRWLDDSHILVRGNLWEQSDITRYLLLDLKTGTIREVTDRTDLTPVPEKP